ncbi:putative fungistatic metabolite [Escovopsis weberi]|uniref:Putative fungistatic metabolite n=1 Tax=Escovopsis weberi TaxID=150374 RepID=A0A0M8N2J6_ESCWE|nr:putative fungistatic metabolite [Escovopsis weberi]
MRSQARLLGLLGLAGLASADPTWPSPKYDEMEEIIYQAQSVNARKFFDTVSPCGNEASGPGRQNAAEWLRTAFHDMATRSDYFDKGGLDASLQYELGNGENTGPGHQTTIEFMGPYLSPRSSLSDLIAAGVYASVRSCGGPVVPYRVGRIDATAKGDVGVPQPENSIFTLQLQFDRMGFNNTEMIQLTICGHTIGGVHQTEFPDLVPEGAGVNGELSLDSSVATFDNRVVTEYLDGSTQNPLVIGPSVRLQKNSDFKVFNSDGNQTVKALTDKANFNDVCGRLLAKMIDTVPTSVKLSDPVVPYAVKPYRMQLTLADGGNTLQWTGSIRVRTTGLADGAIQSVTIHYKNRDGASDCHGSCTVTTTHQGISQGLDDTFSWYPIQANIPVGSGISSFTVDVTTADGTKTYDNNGNGYPLQDAILFQQPQSCVLGSSGALTAVAAVRNDRVDLGAQARIWYKTPQANSPVPLLSNTIVDLEKGACVGQYTLFNINTTITGGLAYQAYLDLINGDHSDSFKALSNMSGTCRPFANAAVCGAPPRDAVTSGPVSGTIAPTDPAADPTSTAPPGTGLPPTSVPPVLTPSMPATTAPPATSTPGPTPTHKPAVGGYVMVSCWTEGDGVRALNGDTFANDTMTLQDCEDFCASFVFWGTEFGRECYCGNTLAKSSGEAPIADCNIPCGGDATEFCGAGNRLELYSTTATQPPAPTGTLAPVPTISPYVLVGCWTEGDGVRALGQAFFTSPDMTNEQCAASCAGFKFFGTEFGNECYCGDFTAASSEAAPDADCGATCAGNQFEFCGGSDRLELYMNPDATGGSPSQPAAVGDFVFAGCQTEGNGTRALSGATTFNTSMTNELCGAFCADFDFFGTEFGAECYCGDALDPSSMAAPAADCQMLCGGNDQEFCGAGNRLSVYVKNGTATRLKSALWYAVGQIVDEESMKRGRNATPQFIGALTEMVWAQIENVAADLESFSEHAGRTTVTTDDVLLLARKNPDLQRIMRAFVEEAKGEREGRKGKGKARMR